MSKTVRVSTAILGVLVLTIVTGFYVINREAVGIPGFYVWRAVSGKAHEGQYADINGIRTYYETFGVVDNAKTPVLVLHGGTGFLETMHYQITALAGDRFVIAPDSRGHGRTTDSDAPISYVQMADDMLALLDKLGIRKVDIVGWSDGGIIGLILAMTHPERVGKLVISGSNYDVSGIEHSIPIDISSDSEIFKSQRDFYKKIAPAPDHWPVFFAKLMHMWRSEPNYTTDDLAKITAPVLVMAGETDSIRREHTEAMAKAIPNSSLRIIEAATHFAPLEKPDEFNQAMLKFFEVGAP